MSRFVPRLVKDQTTGKLCMQISLGGLTATLPLPEDFLSWEETRKTDFFEMATCEMKAQLAQMRRTDQRKLERKWHDS